MVKTELLDRLNALVEKYQQHRAFIERAREQERSGRFSAAVIGKVISDHEHKSTAVSVEVAPLLPELDAIVAELVGERNRIQGSKGSVEEEVQEHELRMAIGEIDDEAFEAAVGGLKRQLDEANERIETIAAELAQVEGAMARWRSVAGIQPPPAPVAVPAPIEPSPVADPQAEPLQVAFDTIDAEPELAPLALEPSAASPAPEAPLATLVPPGDPFRSEPEPIGPHAARMDMKEDISSVLGGAPAEAEPQLAVDEDIAIETADLGEDAGAEVQFGFDTVEGGVGEAEVDIDLGGNEPSEENLQSPEPARQKVKGAEADQPRRAVLLYLEGSAEELIYPFPPTGDVLTIGRGRENDIQIKNDSKVSRYHCRLFRRGNNFYIEDVKSSNGTLVNGEHITERRLFGGEEVIIGETFFRFRIMD